MTLPPPTFLLYLFIYFSIFIQDKNFSDLQYMQKYIDKNCFPNLSSEKEKLSNKIIAI